MSTRIAIAVEQTCLSNEGDMAQQLAVVTGASGGLGSYICEFICKAGVELVLVDRDPIKSGAFAATLAKRFPGLVKQACAVDLADHRDIRRLTDQLLAAYPRIDYLFNNAGVLTERPQFSRHHNELHFEVNTLAPLQLIDQLRAALRAARGAIVVNTSAGLSLRAKTLEWDELLKPTTFRKLYGPYVNSKAALNVLTAALAQEVAADGILLRAADPGPNRTGLTKGKGTPLWMRVFYPLLPTADTGAKRIFDAGFSQAFGAQTGVFLSGGKVQPLPSMLRAPGFQRSLLAQCRHRASILD
jgi:NAD(P)-dependent dehydrogenase (short-subunit alcohol dehydrogenase family)